MLLINAKINSTFNGLLENSIKLFNVFMIEFYYLLIEVVFKSILKLLMILIAEVKYKNIVPHSCALS